MLPHNVVMENKYGEHKTLKSINCDYGVLELDGGKGSYDSGSVTDWKPCLRPMDSMCQSEWEEWRSEFTMPLGAASNATSFKAYNYVVADFGYRVDVHFDEIDRMVHWLNARHFDHLGLIPKGLAVKAKDGMYND